MPGPALHTIMSRLRKSIAAPTGGGLTDAELLDRWVARQDEAALEVLLWRHGPMVLGVCRRILRQEQDAEDAFQATFFTLVKRATSVVNKESLAGWLYRVAHRTALAAKARSARLPVLVDQFDQAAAEPRDEVGQRELWAAFDQELHRLPERYRRVFVLCCLEDRTNEDAARELNCPVGTVATRLRWARGRLSARLAQRGLTLSNLAATAALGPTSVRAAIACATGKIASPQVLSLARGVMEAMSLARWKSAAGLLLALVAVVAGVGLVARNGLAPGREPALPARAEPGPNPERKPEKPRPPMQVAKDNLLRWGGGTAESEKAVADGLAWLARQQAKDGHWTVGGTQGAQADVAGTALGLLPFLGAGITHKTGEKESPYGPNVERGLKWLVARQTEKGDFGSDFMYAHAMAAMAVCTAYGLTGDPELKGPAQASLDFIVRAQGRLGGWRYTSADLESGDTSITSWQVQALWIGQSAGLDVPKTAVDQAMKWYDRVQAKDLGYGYVQANASPSMTAAGLLSRQMLGWSPNRAELVSGVEVLRKSPPGGDSIYHDYYATQALFLGGGTAWGDWNPKMRDILIKRQEKGDKAAGDVGSWPYDWDQYGKSAGRLYVTSLSLLTLEVYYRLDLVSVARARPAGDVKDADVWADLAAPDRVGRQTVWVLARDPKRAVALIKDKVRPVTPIAEAESATIARLIRELDDDDFATREKAGAELDRLGGKAEGLLRKTLDGQPSPEVRRRAERLLEKIENEAPVERTRGTRALAVLESVGTPEAREVLESLAKGDPEAWLTREAKATLDRLSK